jgi:hypothetical protein
MVSQDEYDVFLKLSLLSLTTIPEDRRQASHSYLPKERYSGLDCRVADDKLIMYMGIIAQD